jgi:Transglycosylase SLT domain
MCRGSGPTPGINVPFTIITHVPQGWVKLARRLAETCVSRKPLSWTNIMEIDSIIGNAASRIAGAIRKAAHSTGASFEYLLTTARIESNLNPTAQASTSSAKGLYQFIEQTWLGTMKRAGQALGYGQYANGIYQSSDGRYQVPDPQLHAEIMKLRNDPTASAAMAGAFTQTNAAQVAASIGRPPSEGELYIAHFLGPDGAARLIGAAATQPQANAATLFPQAAAANRSIFYDGSGRARSAAAVYGKLTSLYEHARSVVFKEPVQTASPAVVTPTIRMASQTTTPPVPPADIPNVAPRHSPDPAGVTQAFAKANVSRPAAAPAQPLFQSMFTDRPNLPVTRTVSSLWTPAGPMPSAPSTPPVQALDLFTDIKPGARKLLGGGA